MNYDYLPEEDENVEEADVSTGEDKVATGPEEEEGTDSDIAGEGTDDSAEI